MKFVDCQCFAGGLTYSFVSEGFELVGKREHTGGFGVPACEGNRHVLGDGWETEMTDPTLWTPKRVDVVAGNPPCSGFSSLNTGKNRGIDAPINQCMRDFTMFAAKCKPIITVMESVQQAFSKGRPLMVSLRESLEAITGEKYTITHLLHSCAALGGTQLRRRYFLVMSRVPFGVEQLEWTRCKTGWSHIEHLENAKETWDDVGHGDSHHDVEDDHHVRVRKLLEIARLEEGEKIGVAIDRAQDAGYTLKDFEAIGWPAHACIACSVDAAHDGFHSVERVRRNGLWPVISGGSLGQQIHPTKPRCMTYRELATLMGYPKEWSLKMAPDHKTGPAWLGKGVTTHCGKWCAKWVARALNGQPGDMIGEEIGDREFKVNVSNRFIKPQNNWDRDDERE
jgi:site-specific DNA-cytosine methylase